MAFLYLLFILLVFVSLLALILYFFVDLTQRAKWTIVLFLLVGWIGVGIYTYIQKQKRIYHDMLYYQFLHGKELECLAPFNKRVNVDRKHFNFVSGTMVFMGKEGISYEGVVVPIDRCRVKGSSGD